MSGGQECPPLLVLYKGIPAQLGKITFLPPPSLEISKEWEGGESYLTWLCRLLGVLGAPSFVGLSIPPHRKILCSIFDPKY